MNQKEKMDRTDGSRNILNTYNIVKKSRFNLNSRENGVINLNVVTWADADANTYMCWGDYWVKENLVKAFTSLGINVEVSREDADVSLYLWGAPFPEVDRRFGYNSKTYNVIWFYSHPDRMTKTEMARYDLVFCLSPKMLDILKFGEWHPNICGYHVPSCTDFSKPLIKPRKDIDVLFVGNARGGTEWGREAIYWLDRNSKLIIQIYGHKWNNGNYEYAKRWYAGRYWEYEKLNELYCKAKITLVDGHDDMNRLGFVPMKLYDILASGGFALAQYNCGIKDVFGDSIPMYKNKGEMNDKIDYYLKNQKERDKLSKKGFDIAIEGRFLDRAKLMLKKIREQSE